MVGSYSPHGDAGGTLHLLSPTHIHHVDPTSALRQLRRSLSRSPSKTPAFRLVTSKSASPTPSSPLSPSREPQQAVSASSSVPPAPHVPLSSFTTPHAISARRPRASARRVSPMRSNLHPAKFQRSPRKRSLNESTNSGNVTPNSSRESSRDQENLHQGSVSPVAQPSAGLKASAPPLQNSPFPPPRGVARFEKGYSSWSAKSSPLKRSDGIMNLDHGGAGSPSAKRRSLHGGIFGPDFDIFDHEAAMESQDISMGDGDVNSEMLTPDRLSPKPKRTSSLRKSTLQQRYDKPLFAKPKVNAELGSEIVTPGAALPKNRFRASLDNAFPPVPRDSPFATQGGLPNASAHILSQPSGKQGGINSSQPQRHPLSRTISQSTSTSSLAEDSPTHIPVRQIEHRRPFADFSKSLPLGATRPSSREGGSSSQFSGTSFETPENYKLVKPLPAAFMSTGLISKRHKHVDDEQPALNASTSTMPDTPCKRHSLVETSSPTATQQEPFVKPQPMRHSFGTPSTPFNPHVTRPETFGKGLQPFGSGFGSAVLQQRAGLVGREVDEQFTSPPRHEDSQSSTEFEIPPTPTKQALLKNDMPTPLRPGSCQSGFAERIPTASPVASNASASFQKQNSKSLSIGRSSESANGCGGAFGDAPSTSLISKGFFSTPKSFTNSRILRNSRSPTPLNHAFLSVPKTLPERSKAKHAPILASPLSGRYQGLSPRTPRENMMPPDPSGLSISVQGDELRTFKDGSGGKSIPPATPTAPRGSLASMHKSNASLTPSHTPAVIEIDPVLTARFDKVEIIGTGEFSQVYRVSKAQEMKNVRSYFSIPTSRGSPKTPLPDKVWAVKKTRHAYIGPKDRQRKLQEVNTLKSLGQSDHTLELYESWEHKNHLYIQTEFCEEGSLDTFLDQVGRQARLDDFRIWKILLEMSLVSNPRSVS